MTELRPFVSVPSSAYRYAGFLPLLLWLCAGCGSPPAPLPPPPSGLAATPLELAAELERARTETARLDLGTPAGDLRLGEGWLSAETLEDGTTFVWATGGASSFEIDLVAPRDVRLEARGWPYRRPGGSTQHIQVQVNGERAAEFRMPPGLEVSSVEIAERFVRAGMNRITLLPRVMRESAAEPAISAAWDYFEIAGATGGAPALDAGRLLLPFPSAVDFYLHLDGEAKLVFDRLAGHSSARLKVTLASDVASDVASDAAPGGRQAPFEAVLGPQDTAGVLSFGERRGLHRLTLAALQARGSGGALELIAPRMTAALAGAASGGEAWTTEVGRVALEPSPKRPNVLLYVIDTLRADRLGCYGHQPPEGPVSPRIDAFAADGVLFEETSAQSSWTRASMATIMTGFRPSRHGVETRRDALPPQALTLAELLSANGYRTAGVITNGNAGANFGLAQGFDSFELLHGPGHGLPAGVEVVNQRARQLLDSQLADRSRPFFLYLHTMEPHAPYVIKERLPGDLQDLELEPGVIEALQERGVRIGGPTDFGSVLWVQALFHRLLPADAETGAELGLAYDAAIRHNDRYFGELLTELEKRGLLEQTVVVLLSDHGEELFDHGSWSHGLTLYEEQLRVPFIMRFPGERAPRGVRSQRRARQVDVLPTLLDYLSLPTPPDLDGSSLIAPPAAPAHGFADLDLDGRRATSWVEGAHKLICDLKGKCRLFDLQQDPGEQEDLAADLPVTASYLKAKLEAARARAQALSAVEAELDPELERQLEALGYI